MITYKMLCVLLSVIFEAFILSSHMAELPMGVHFFVLNYKDNSEYCPSEAVLYTKIFDQPSKNIPCINLWDIIYSLGVKKKKKTLGIINSNFL